jgi:predicted transport protein
VGPAAELFQAFRKDVLALSPEVTEEFRKLYMAYKVGGANFVSVVPRKASLPFFLNLNMIHADFVGM